MKSIDIQLYENEGDAGYDLLIHITCKGAEFYDRDCNKIIEIGYKDYGGWYEWGMRYVKIFGEKDWEYPGLGNEVCVNVVIGELIRRGYTRDQLDHMEDSDGPYPLERLIETLGKATDFAELVAYVEIKGEGNIFDYDEDNIVFFCNETVRDVAQDIVEDLLDGRTDEEKSLLDFIDVDSYAKCLVENHEYHDTELGCDTN